MSVDVRVETLVVYQSPNGGKYHRSAECCRSDRRPSQLDAAADVLSAVESHRVGDVSPDESELCDNCAGQVQRWL